MMEAMIVYCIIMLCRLVPLRGKTFEQLNEKQKAYVQNNYSRYSASKKGQTNPMTIEQYLPTIQKQPLYIAITLAVLVAIYVAVIIWVYPMVIKNI